MWTVPVQGGNWDDVSLRLRFLVALLVSFVLAFALLVSSFFFLSFAGFWLSLFRVFFCFSLPSCFLPVLSFLAFRFRLAFLLLLLLLLLPLLLFWQLFWQDVPVLTPPPPTPGRPTRCGEEDGLGRVRNDGRQPAAEAQTRIASGSAATCTSRPSATL